MLKVRRNLITITLAMVGIMMSTSHAKPDLTTPVDLSMLHAKDTGYRFVHHTFMAPAPQIPYSGKPDLQTKTAQSYAKPRHYQVWLGIPEQPFAHKPANHASLPNKIIYMLDGNAAIDDLDKDRLHARSHSSPQNAAPILVFIGYQTPYRFDVDARAYDYTPPLLLTETGYKNAFQEDGRDRLNGGAEHFYSLIENEIKPWVYQQLGTKPKQEAIWGHSYGGLFVLYTLFKHPEAYEQYFSADPSLWWQDGEMTRYWRAYQDMPESHPSEQSKITQLRLTFSQSPKQTTTPVTVEADVAIPLSKQAFAEEVCTHFKDNCRYQFFDQSHGELFKTSLLESLDSL